MHVEFVKFLPPASREEDIVRSRGGIELRL